MAFKHFLLAVTVACTVSSLRKWRKSWKEQSCSGGKMEGCSHDTQITQTTMLEKGGLDNVHK